MSNTIRVKTEEETKPKSSYKMYFRLIAVVLVVVLVGAAILNRPQLPSMEDMKTASLTEEGTDVVVQEEALLDKLQALEKVNELQNELNQDYQNCIKYIEAGEYERAIPLLKKLLEYLEDDETIGAYLRASLCEIYFSTGKYSECADSCDIFIEKGNDPDGTYRFMAGVARMQTGDFEKAIVDIQAAVDAGYPQVGMAKAQIALASVYLGKYEEAMKASQDALAEEHDASLDEVLHYINAIGLLQAGSYEEGKAEFDQLIENYEPNGEYNYYRGVAYMAQEQYAEAAVDFREALDQGYETSSCWYNYGICAIMAEEYENGLAALQKVVELNEDETYVADAQALIDQLTGTAD